jgi:diguanylate cyclase (GGDEF)-like protein/PAS domain S-box-containing protein
MLAMQSGEARIVEESIRSIDGKILDVETINAAVRDATGKCVGVLAIARDITRRKQAEQHLRGLMTYKQAILASAPVGIIVLGMDRTITEANEAAGRMFGYAPAELIGRSSAILFTDPETDADVEAAAWPVIRAGGIFSIELAMYRHDGSKILVSRTCSLIDAEQPKIGIIVTLEDVTERRAMERQLQQYNAALRDQARELKRLARTDPLTGLANRWAFHDAIEMAFGRFRRHSADAALLVLDVDRFKQINDTHGHDIGDQALIALANILTSSTRETDLAARLGGEEFVVLLPGTNLTGALALAEHLRSAVNAFIVPSPRGAFRMTVSIGVANFAASHETWCDIIACADRAMYRAKSEGRDRVIADTQCEAAEA